MTAPMESVKQHCVFMDGFGLDGRGDTHEGGANRVLTGDHASTDNLRGTSSSIDVLMGEENFLPYFDNPLSLYANLFSGDQTPAQATIAQDNLSALNAAHANLQSLQVQFGTIERERLEQHMEAFSVLQSKLQALASGSGGASCGNTDLSDIGNNDWRNENPSGPMTRISDAQQDIAVQALSCDVTRVISFMYSHAVSPITNPTGTMGDHDASHADAETHRKSKVWWMAEITKFIQKLADTPDGDGSSGQYPRLFSLRFGPR